jgi:predicted secreted Zn-dependent protease
MNTQKSRFQGLFEPQVSQPEQPERKRAAKKAPGEETMKVRNQETKKSRKEEEGTVTRIKTNYEIRQDYVRAVKRIALDEDRNIYEVLEQAIGEYLERHKESKA